MVSEASLDWWEKDSLFRFSDLQPPWINKFGGGCEHTRGSILDSFWIIDLNVLWPQKKRNSIVVGQWWGENNPGKAEPYWGKTCLIIVTWGNGGRSSLLQADSTAEATRFRRRLPWNVGAAFSVGCQWKESESGSVSGNASGSARLSEQVEGRVGWRTCSSWWSVWRDPWILKTGMMHHQQESHCGSGSGSGCGPSQGYGSVSGSVMGSDRESENATERSSQTVIDFSTWERAKKLLRWAKYTHTLCTNYSLFIHSNLFIHYTVSSLPDYRIYLMKHVRVSSSCEQN